MLILALDSTSAVGSVALCKDTKPLARQLICAGNTHSETLLPAVEHLLRLTGRDLSQVELFACTTGPGSFTGVRIGVATVKGLAFGRKVPCVGVSAMEALAYNLVGLDGIYCPVMNARHGQLYNALFTCQNGVLTRLCPDRILSIAELDRELSELCPKEVPIRPVGDGYALVQSEFRLVRPASVPLLLREQNALSVALAAHAAFLRGEFCDQSLLVPVYLRPSQAERTRAEAEKSNKGHL